MAIFSVYDLLYVSLRPIGMCDEIKAIEKRKKKRLLEDST